MSVNTNVNINESASAVDRLYFLDNLRFVGIAFVVTIHLCSYLHNDFQYVKYLSFYAVPIFFICDGYLFSKSKASNKPFSYSTYFSKNIFRLFIPWLFFSIVYLAARFLAERFHLVSGQVVLGKPVFQILIDAYASVHSGQMYFLLSLFMIRAISPLVLGKCSLLSASIAFIGALLIYNFFSLELHHILYVEGGNEPLIHAIWGTQFYFLGALAFTISRIISPALLSGIFFIATLAVLKIFYIPALFLMTSLVLIFFIFYCLFNIEIAVVSYLGKRTMGIYLIHMPIVVNIIVVLFSRLNIPSLLLVLCGVIACIIISNQISWFLLKYRAGKIILGEGY